MNNKLGPSAEHSHLVTVVVNPITHSPQRYQERSLLPGLKKEDYPLRNNAGFVSDGSQHARNLEHPNCCEMHVCHGSMWIASGTFYSSSRDWVGGRRERTALLFQRMT